MNLSLPDQNTLSSNESCLEDDKPAVMLPCFRRSMYDEPLASYSNRSIISQLLRKTIHNKRALDETHFYLSSSAAADSGQDDHSSVSSKDSTLEAASPGDHISTGASPEGENPMTDHLQAKRARVENIIRVMAGSPNSKQHGETEKSDAEVRDTREARESFRENKRKQRLPQHQEHSSAGGEMSRKPGSGSDNTKEEECHKLKEQLHSMQRILHQLQEKFLQVYSQENPEYDNRDATEADSDHDLLREKVESCYISTEEEQEKDKSTATLACKDRIKAIGYGVPEREIQSLQETLKHELSRAMNDCLDRVFKKVSSTGINLSPEPRMCSSPEIPISTGADRKSQLTCSTLGESEMEESVIKSQSSEFYESSEAQSPQDQTEALSLVVRKPTETPVSSITPAVKRPYPVHHTPFQFSYTNPLHENHILEHLLKYGPHTSFGLLPCMPPSMDRTSPDSMNMSWDAVGMRSKVTSSHFGHHPRSSSLGAVAVDGLCVPHVKMESGELQSMAERNPYMSLNIQEGLTPSHLKKAKLMFFYTRYPSSNALKTFFPDVKFNRCITSQLIKWFSNFREFYYIQMEKFARQAIIDGITDVKDITVSRDSELFRALNMHYNKANDFHVPDRFLEVAEITLHEFYNAISAAKDSDPSWKKAIYKVICKLDNDIPEDFKTSSYL
ncbi:prospero homeobox protein 2 [Nothobranchius furzeri]|uniref:prospero homeobox protein 2 n=1 Tax=Nothobranchius furzeri TaxID=105023 RepID=UPI00077D2B40